MRSPSQPASLGSRHGDSALRRQTEAVRDHLRALATAARERPRPVSPAPPPGPPPRPADDDPWSLDPLSPLP